MTNRLLLLPLVAACSGPSSAEIPADTDTAPTASDTDTTPVTTDTDTTPACEPLPGVPGEDVAMTTQWEGRERTWVLHLPTDYNCEPLPLIIGVHGYFGTGRGFENDTARMFDHLNANGYIGVFPDGLAAGPSGYPSLVTSFNDLTSRFDDGPDGQTCTNNAYDYVAYDNCGPGEAGRTCRWGTSCADDVGLFRTLIDEVSTSWTVDPDRIYMTGFSQGGQTVQGVACELADVLAAISPHHGFAANGYTCGPTTKLPILQVWGTEDRTVDGHEQPSNDGMIYDGGDETAAQWAAEQGCAATGTPYPTVSDDIRGWACIEHAGCSTGAEVVSCSWNGGHVWGRSQADGDFALDAMWDFFQKHSR